MSGKYATFEEIRSAMSGNKGGAFVNVDRYPCCTGFPTESRYIGPFSSPQEAAKFLDELPAHEFASACVYVYGWNYGATYAGWVQAGENMRPARDIRFWYGSTWHPEHLEFQKVLPELISEFAKKFEGAFTVFDAEKILCERFPLSFGLGQSVWDLAWDQRTKRKAAAKS